MQTLLPTAITHIDGSVTTVEMLTVFRFTVITTPSRCCGVQVQVVRQVLHVAAAPTGQLPLCRQSQVTDLQAFLGNTLQECRGGSIYVSGVPGTGTCRACPQPMNQINCTCIGTHAQPVTLQALARPLLLLTHVLTQLRTAKKSCMLLKACACRPATLQQLTWTCSAASQEAVLHCVSTL